MLMIASRSRKAYHAVVPKMKEVRWPYKALVGWITTKQDGVNTINIISCHTCTLIIVCKRDVLGFYNACIICLIQPNAQGKLPISNTILILLEQK